MIIDKQNWLYAVAGGVFSALMVLAGFYNPVVAATITNFCHVPLFMVALALGQSGAVLGSLAGTALLLLTAKISGLSGGALFYLFLVAMPSVVIGYFALLSRPVMGRIEWYPIGQVLSWLVAAVFAIYTTFYLAASNPDSPWTMELQNQIVNYVSAQLPPEQQLPIEVLQSIVASILPYFPGLIISLFLSAIVINGLIAQWILIRCNRHQRPMPQMADLDLPNFTPIVVAALGLVAAFASNWWQVWAINLLIIMVIPLLLAGLSVVHLLVRASPSRLMWLSITYIALIFSALIYFIPVFFIAAIGLAEQWLELRKKQPSA
jgi:hypothetical protein